MYASLFAESLSADQTTVILIVLIGCLTGAAIVIGTTVAGVWWKIVSARLDAELKHAMIERGMSAASIVAVLEARGRRGGCGTDRVRFPEGSTPAEHDADPYSYAIPRKGPTEAEV
jgi:hypothetical protein